MQHFLPHVARDSNAGAGPRTLPVAIALLSAVTVTGCGSQAGGGESRTETDTAGPPVTTEAIAAAEQVIGLEFTEAERRQMLEPAALFSGLEERRAAYARIRREDIGNDVPPALIFRPHPPAVPVERGDPDWPAPPSVDPPEELESLAFASVRELGALLRAGHVTSVELTRMYLDRLRRHDSVLHAVVTLTEDLALEQARRADRELRNGTDRGPLHGIPYGLKDLFSVPDYPTTWGATPYRDQVLDETATVASRLEEAGAVLVAKTTLGALAWGDVWFGGRTRNPWNTEQGSGGSSAGSAATVSAGLVPFAIGTETLGSILSPSTRTGVTGLRPSFGRVSRHGGMFVSWSMDKVGPICRRALDCALVFDAIRGPDGEDPTLVDRPFPFEAAESLEGRRIGYVQASFERDYDGREADRRVLDVLRELGAEMVPIELPDRPVESLAFILAAEAATAHDSLTRTDLDSTLVRQQAAAWPNVYRTARFVPAVEYLQANQVRWLLGRDMRQLMTDLDAYVAPTSGGPTLLLTNLTGHPSVAVPNGFDDGESPRSITFVGTMYGEADLLEIVSVYQDATGWDERHPPEFTPADADSADRR
ncbi:MAG: amidase [Candidatus Palauibacterales bacterium]|nr:amidase [Candidatus Palauibacterales bacterium]